MRWTTHVLRGAALFVRSAAVSLAMAAALGACSSDSTQETVDQPIDYAEEDLGAANSRQTLICTASRQCKTIPEPCAPYSVWAHDSRGWRCVDVGPALDDDFTYFAVDAAMVILSGGGSLFTKLAGAGLKKALSMGSVRIVVATAAGSQATKAVMLETVSAQAPKAAQSVETAVFNAIQAAHSAAPDNSIVMQIVGALDISKRTGQGFKVTMQVNLKALVEASKREMRKLALTRDNNGAWFVHHLTHADATSLSMLEARSGQKVVVVVNPAKYLELGEGMGNFFTHVGDARIPMVQVHKQMVQFFMHLQ